MNANNKNCVNISISTQPDIIDRINKYTTYKTNNKYATGASVHLPRFQTNYYSDVPKGDKSVVFTRIIDKYLKKLEKKDFEKLFLSRSELIRMAITDDMLQPMRKQALTEYFKEQTSNECLLKKFLELFPFPIRKRKMNYNKHVILGNRYHPNGLWKKNHDKHDLEKFQRFCIIRDKLKDRVSETVLRNDFEKFNKLYQDGKIDDLKLYDQQNETIK